MGSLGCDPPVLSQERDTPIRREERRQLSPNCASAVSAGELHSVPPSSSEQPHSQTEAHLESGFPLGKMVSLIPLSEES